MMAYFSDASLPTDSDLEEEETAPKIYCPRELEYWELERLLESRGPPVVIEYLKNVGVVTLRECVVGRLRADIESAVDLSSALCWKAFWSGNSFKGTAPYSFDDWDAIGEFCMQMCQCCTNDPTTEHVKSVMINVLRLKSFSGASF